MDNELECLRAVVRAVVAERQASARCFEHAMQEQRARGDQPGHDPTEALRRLTAALADCRGAVDAALARLAEVAPETVQPPI
jgi:hypothetical protein